MSWCGEGWPGGESFFLAKREEISGPPARRGEMRGGPGAGGGKKRMELWSGVRGRGGRKAKEEKKNFKCETESLSI